MANFIDRTGAVFWRLTVVKHLGGGLWRCECQCGATTVVSGGQLTRGKTKSCGCLRREVTGAKRRTHGMTNTRTYRIWNGMNTRCYNPERHDYDRYGGRGITVCAAWQRPDGFTAFLADMGQCPDGMTLERRDNNGPYSKDNCYWVPAAVQARNKRNSVMYAGKCAAEWARELGVTTSAVLYRLRKFGSPYSPEKPARPTPARPTRDKYFFGGKTLRAWAKDNGIPYETALYRLCKYGTPIKN